MCTLATAPPDQLKESYFLIILAFRETSNEISFNKHGIFLQKPSFIPIMLQP